MVPNYIWGIAKKISYAILETVNANALHENQMQMAIPKSVQKIWHFTKAWMEIYYILSMFETKEGHFVTPQLLHRLPGIPPAIHDDQIQGQHTETSTHTEEVFGRDTRSSARAEYDADQDRGEAEVDFNPAVGG